MNEAFLQLPIPIRFQHAIYKQSNVCIEALHGVHTCAAYTISGRHHLIGLCALEKLLSVQCDVVSSVKSSEVVESASLNQKMLLIVSIVKFH